MFTSSFLKLLNKEASSGRSRPGEVIERLHIQEGQSIEDVGSGGGYFTLVFARNVGSTGRVYAVDVKTKYLDFIRIRAEQAGLGNIVFVLGGKEDLDLPESGLDLIFARNVFHHLPDPSKYFAGLKKYLKPGGRVAVIEHVKKGFGFTSLFGHHTSRSTIVADMEQAGYVEAGSFDFLPKQSFTLFEKGASRNKQGSA